MASPLPTGAISASAITPGQLARVGAFPPGGLVGPDGRPLSSASFRSPFDYGPGVPLMPWVDRPRPPREYQYPIGWNLIASPRSESTGSLSFASLRALAKAAPYVAIAVEYRKKQLRGLDWDIVPVEDRNDPELKKKFAAEIKRVKTWLRKPDKMTGLPFGTWLGQAANEVLITDALCWYKWRTRGGDPLALFQVDGATIKPLIDEFGVTVEYQQILYGYPATQYQVPVNVGDAVDRNDFLYCVYNPRVDSPYGTSPIEEIEKVVSIAVKRASRQLAYYTDGTTPEAVLEAPPGWNKDQISEFQNYLDEKLSGDDKERARVRLMPHDSKYQETRAFQFSKDEEEAILAQVMAHYGVPRSILVSQVNKSTADDQREQAVDTGLKPLCVFFAEILTEFVQGDLGAPEMEFRWVSEAAGAGKAKAEEDSILINAGVITPNEARRNRGLIPVTGGDEMRQTASPIGNVNRDKDGRVGADEEDDQDPPKAKLAAKSADPATDLAKWQRYAMKRIGKASIARFDSAAIPPAEHRRIGALLLKASTPREVRDAFTKAAPKKRLTASVLARARRTVQGAAVAYLEACRVKSAEVAKDDVTDARDEFLDATKKALKDVFSASAADQESGLDFEFFEPRAEDYATKRAGELVTEIDETTRKRVAELTEQSIAEGWSTDKLASELDEAGVFGEARAETIARTEIAIAQNRGQTDALKAAGFTHVRVYDGDADQECAAADGQVWTLDEADANPIAHPNCTRAFAPVAADELEEAA